MLCRVCSYSTPGFPSPAIRRTCGVFSSTAAQTKIRFRKTVLVGANQDRADPNSLLLLLFFLWDRRGRGRFTLFLFLANHFGSSHSCGFSHNWFFFDCWGKNREWREIGRHRARGSRRQLDLASGIGGLDV